MAVADLPFGQRGSGGNLPEYVAASVDRLLELAGPLKRFPLQAAKRYLARWPDPDRERRLGERQEEIDRQSSISLAVAPIDLKKARRCSKAWIKVA